ncbi:MAG: putative toxin-antitoxin system toxin component, PIN family [Gallionella sp.]|nr:putative toxin-antitoxin system toxin component, PIN family [Gallionella sp.]
MLWVLDTNIVASGLLWNGTPARLLDAAQTDEVALFTSLILLAELTRILRREKFGKVIAASGLTLDALVLAACLT